MSETSEKKECACAGSKRCCAIVCGLCLCATIGLAAYVLTQRPQRRPRLWSPVVVDTNGVETTILGETRQLEFWTPSAETKDYLRKEGGNVADSEKWQVISNDDAVLKFGTMLHTNASVLGYRRLKVWGHGRSAFKPGWWWTLNVLTNYSAGNLAHAYEGFWKSHGVLFVEVIDSRGRDE
jgi:hypothetical protein